MVEGWKPVVIPRELFEFCRAYFEDQGEELKLREGVRSVSAFMNYCLLEQLKKRGAI